MQRCGHGRRHQDRDRRARERHPRAEARIGRGRECARDHRGSVHQGDQRSDPSRVPGVRLGPVVVGGARQGRVDDGRHRQLEARVQRHGGQEPRVRVVGVHSAEASPAAFGYVRLCSDRAEPPLRRCNVVEGHTSRTGDRHGGQRRLPASPVDRPRPARRRAPRPGPGRHRAGRAARDGSRPHPGPRRAGDRGGALRPAVDRVEQRPGRPRPRPRGRPQRQAARPRDDQPADRDRGLCGRRRPVRRALARVRLGRRARAPRLHRGRLGLQPRPQGDGLVVGAVRRGVRRAARLRVAGR